MKRGVMLIADGIDGAGTETQSKLLFDYFKGQKKPVKRLCYPDYSKPIGKLIHEYLHKKYDFPVEVQFLLYATDYIKDRKKINNWLKESKIIICDRYFTSTLAYQGSQGFSVEKMLEFAKLFEIKKPDIIIYLKVSPEVSISRKFKEKRSLDRNEANIKFLVQVSEFYEKLIKKQVFGKWVAIDGEKSIQEVFKDIKKVLKIERII